MRLQWTVLDRTQASQPLRWELLDNVEAMTIRFLDPTRQWHTEWPPEGIDELSRLRLQPIGAEITIELGDWGVVTRLVEIPG